MALITCPECQQQISDQATVCPKCGFPLTAGVSSAPSDSQNDEVLDVCKGEPNETARGTYSTPDRGRKKKYILFAGIAIVCIALIATIAILANNHAKALAAEESRAAEEARIAEESRAAEEARNEYIENLNLFLIETITGGAKAETVCNLTKQVWHDTIFEEYNSDTVEYTKTNGVFNDDFNTSLQRLYASDQITEYVDAIKENQADVDALYKKLLNPDDEFEKCFEEVEAIYSIYYKFTNLAISPAGSLQTYSENFNNYDNDFMEHYNKLNLLIPEE